MRMYVEMEAEAPDQLIIDGREFKDPMELVEWSFPIVRNNARICMARFYWTDRLVYRFWLLPEETRMFEKEIFQGILIPRNVRFVMDSVSDQAARHFEKDEE